MIVITPWQQITACRNIYLDILFLVLFLLSSHLWMISLPKLPALAWWHYPDPGLCIQWLHHHQVHNFGTQLKFLVSFTNYFFKIQFFFAKFKNLANLFFKCQMLNTISFLTFKILIFCEIEKLGKMIFTPNHMHGAQVEFFEKRKFGGLNISRRCNFKEFRVRASILNTVCNRNSFACERFSLDI